MEKKSPGVTPPQSIQGGAYNTTQVRAQPSYPPIQRNPNLRVPYHSPTSSNIPFHHERPLSQQMYDRSPIYPQLEPSAPPVQDMYEHPQMQFAQQLRPIAMNQRMIDEFLSYGYPSLERGIEFCAVICAKLKSGRFECSHMLIPKQTATPNSCNATNEVELFQYQDINDLITVGWIHVCFNLINTNCEDPSNTNSFSEYSGYSNALWLSKFATRGNSNCMCATCESKVC